MYKIKNMIFGWDYVQWRNDKEQGISRVFKTQDGSVVYWRLNEGEILDEIVEPNQVYWLTCHPDKYF